MPPPIPSADPVGLVCNDEGKLIGLELNRGLRDEHGEIYDIMAGTFLVVGLSAGQLHLPDPGAWCRSTRSTSSSRSSSSA